MESNSPFYGESIHRAVHYANQLLEHNDIQIWEAALRGSKLFNVHYNDVKNHLDMQIDIDLQIELSHQLWRMYRNLELDYT